MGDYLKLNEFVDDGLKKWEQIKKDFSDDGQMSNYLKKAYPVVMFDHYQLDVDLAKNLYKAVYDTYKEKVTPEERKREEFRQKMVIYFDEDLRGVFVEVRFFPYMDIELIQRLKKHPSIQGLNSDSLASINVIIHHCFIKRG